MTTEDSTENMPECTQCPHVIGDYTERDCGFPDCMGGWESAYKALQAELDRRVAEAEERQRDSSKDKPLYEPLNLDLMLDDFHDLADSLGKALDDYDGDEGQEECFNKLLRDASRAILNAGGKGDDNS